MAALSTRNLASVMKQNRMLATIGCLMIEFYRLLFVFYLVNALCPCEEIIKDGWLQVHPRLVD
jgi:hypothetical protein